MSKMNDSASSEEMTIYGDKLNWLPDVKTMFDSAARRFSDNKGMRHALILVDIGGISFEPADSEDSNETGYGLIGEIMSSVAKQILGACGKRDIVGVTGIDRFAVITSGFANRVELEKLISKILYRIRVADFPGGIQLSAEAGAAILENNIASVSELFKAAELALFKVKERSDDDFAIFEDDIDVDQREKSNPQNDASRIQKALDHAFDAFSSEDTPGQAIKNVLSHLGELYDLDRIFIVGAHSDFSNIVQWLGLDAHPVTGAECAWLFDPEQVKLYNAGKCYVGPSSVSMGLFQGFALIGVVCFESYTHFLDDDKEYFSELKTIAKMLSVYQANLVKSSGAEDEILYARAALEENRTACYAVDADSYRIVYHNPYAEKILPGIKIGETCSPQISEILDRIKSGEEKHCDSRGVYHYDTYEKHLQKWLSTAIVCTRRFGGEYAFLVTAADISEFMDNAKTKDKLTGLLTYEGFEIEAEKTLYNSGAQHCLALIKIFNFRNINDEFGYEVGDEILKTAADKMMLILGEGERAARSSGSGFIALLNYSSVNILKAKLEYLFKVVEEDITRKHPLVSFAFMCGIYPIEKENYKLSMAIDRANLVIKNVTRGRYTVNSFVEVYDFELNRALEERKQIESEMVGALRNNEFVMVYQPKVELKTGRVYGAEALIRWNKPDGSVLHPGVFVPIFEDNEFVLEMDHWVYRRVFSNMRSWMEQGLDLPVISVNVSRLHLRDAKFAEKFERIVDNYGIPHKNIEIELTEGTFVNNYDRLIGLMNDIRSRGFKISIDDFGTGYSSLNLISVLPVDVLKLDGNFFMKNELTEKNKKVVESIIMLAKNLGLSVISEGVETDEQVSFLKENRCDAVQGYYYYKPMSEIAFRSLIEKQQKASAENAD